MYVREQRKAAKLTQEELAKAIGVTRVYVSNIENGYQPSTNEPPEVGEDKLRKMAQVFGVPVVDVFNRAGIAPEGFRIVEDSEEKTPQPKTYQRIRLHESERNVELPTDWQDWPPELQEAMAYTTTLSEGAQKYVFGLWLQQARIQAEVSEEIDEQRRELQRIKDQVQAARKHVKE